MNKKFAKKTIASILAMTMALSSMAVTASAYTSDNDSPVLISEYKSDYSLSTTSTTLTKGYQFTLKCNGIKSSDIIWRSSDKSIATVSKTGKVVGKSEGKATISAELPDGEVLYCRVSVVLTKITSDISSTIKTNGDETISATLTVKGDQNLSYKSTDPSVATAGWGSWSGNKINFYIYGGKNGTAKIKIYNKKNNTVYKTFTVTVDDGKVVITPTATNLDLEVNNNYSFPISYSNKTTLKYISDNPSVATMESTYINTNTYCYANLKTGPNTGVAHITIVDSADPTNYTIVTVNVKATVPTSPAVQYYVENTYNIASPWKNNITFRNPTDKLAYWMESGVIKYMIVPENYYANVFDDIYVIPASDYNPNATNVDYADITSYFNEYNILNPTANFSYINKNYYVVYYITDNGKIMYKIVSENKLDKYLEDDDYYVVDRDNNLVSSTYKYYTLLTEYPSFVKKSDNVISFINESKTYYIVTPSKNYDVAVVESIKAKTIGTYEYNTVYASVPTKNASSDEVISFNYKKVTRYILAKTNYDKDAITKIQNDYINNTYSPVNY